MAHAEYHPQETSHQTVTGLKGKGEGQSVAVQSGTRMTQDSAAAGLQKQKKRIVGGSIIVGILAVVAIILSIYFIVFHRASRGDSNDDGRDDILDQNPFPNLTPLSASGSVPVVSLPRPLSPSGSRIVFNAEDTSNIGQYRLAKGDGGNSGAVAIHIALMKGTSKVAMLQRWDYLGTNATLPGSNTPAWSTEYDYTTDAFRPLRLRSNVFCGGGMLLPSGKLMVLGGAENFTELGGLLDGMKSIRLLSPSGSAGKFGSQDWVDDPSNRKISLASKRWYPSVATLPDGRLLVIGGTIVAVAFTSPPNNTGTMEIIPPIREYANPEDALIPLQFLWDTLPANLYPTTAVLPSGRIFITASDRATLLDPSQGYTAVRTFLLRPTAASATSPSSAGVCLQPLSQTGPSDFLATAPCLAPTEFNQNVTSNSIQTFSFFGVPSPSPTNTQIYSNPLGFVQRDAYPGAGWIVHTESKLCLAVVGSRIGFRTCLAEDAAQMFDVGQGLIRHVTTPAPPTKPSPPASKWSTHPFTLNFPVYPAVPFAPILGQVLVSSSLDPQTNYNPTIMICGGSVHPQGLQAVESNASIALSTCGSISPERPDANWTMETMPTPRVLGDLIHLPDGTLLLLNGAQRGMAGWDLGRNPNLAAHLYNPLAPVGRRWSVLDASTIPRMYHSTAMLLPDGRVMVAGSSPNSPTDPTWTRMYENEYRVEYFHPPYLLNINNASRPRPVIAEASWRASTESWSYNVTYSLRVGVSDPSATSTKNLAMINDAQRRNLRFNLIQTGFRTHSTAFGQRMVWLVSSVTGRAEGEVVVAAPPTCCYCAAWVWVQVGGDPAGTGRYYEV
ncbi:glyoxal oxidase N-terminus-domain-containing protein [Chytridium lagenaria]|nr:glyoxal oxidase N-terminus-domain-containing protein [Chytridium lagenaria]